ncbi:MAG: SRPBCC domain-containing protein [Bacteroidetes bacterium]|nr:SRPBCC domain-containing protein [Bacteroidota bacterium]
MNKDLQFEITYVVYAAPAIVFEAIVNAEKIREWGGGDSLLELKEGGKFMLFDNWVTGEVQAFTKNKMLKHTWKPNTWSKKAEPSVVTYNFAAHPSGCEIRLTHENFPNQKEMLSHQDGWIDNVFEPLNDWVIEQR